MTKKNEWGDGMGMEVNEAEYYKNLCKLQRETLEACWNYIHRTTGSTSIDNPSPDEWSMGNQCFYLKKDNDALRELCDEYREILRGKTN